MNIKGVVVMTLVVVMIIQEEVTAIGSNKMMRVGYG
jgi:hypothetical protein